MDEERHANIAFMAGLLLGMVIAGAIGICVVTDSGNWWRRQAVEKGAAEWVIDDPQTGRTVWRWKVDAK